VKPKQICEICLESENAEGNDHELYDMGDGHLYCNPCIQIACHEHTARIARMDELIAALKIAQCRIFTLEGASHEYMEIEAALAKTEEGT